MLARSGLAGKTPSRPHLGPSETIFSIGRKNLKNAKILPIFLGGPMGPIPGIVIYHSCCPIMRQQADDSKQWVAKKCQWMAPDEQGLPERQRKFGDLETWKSRNLGSEKSKK